MNNSTNNVCFAICIEASHQKGMGHLFRAINIINLLKEKNHNYILLINNDPKSINIIKNEKINFEIVNLYDFNSNWETSIINKYNPTIWLNDRLDTNIQHAYFVKNNSIKLITFDDYGSGANIADLNIIAIPAKPLDNIKTNKILTGLDYIILNPEIKKYRKLRSSAQKIIISLGGSDTYNVTSKVINTIKHNNLTNKYIFDVSVGPNFKHLNTLQDITPPSINIIQYPKSLIELFSNYDIAITNGSITALEAAASGMPLITIANEPHEIQTCKYLQQLNIAIFWNYHNIISETDHIPLDNIAANINSYSYNALNKINLNGIYNIYNEIISL